MNTSITKHRPTIDVCTAQTPSDMGFDEASGLTFMVQVHTIALKII